MEISYKLDNFEGPLDLLLHLIEKNKVSIYDIPIVLITEQYLEYVNQMDHEDLDVVSDFLVMAATLLDIKSRMLLPKVEKEEEEDEEDPRAELVRRLLEYKMYKYMAQELEEREQEAELLFFKEPTIPREVAKYEEPLDLDKLLDGLTLAKLQKVFDAVMKRNANKLDPVRSRFSTIRREPISLEQKVRSVLSYAREHRHFKFSDVLERESDRLEIVVAFLAVLELMKLVGITDAEKRIKNYPHQLSGGMRQRIVIAIALACDPELLICDEPTTALDVTIQSKILELIQEIQKKRQLSVIYITHDLGVVAKVADYVNVMYAGKIVESGTVEDVFYDPRHPYTWGLLSAMPDLGTDDERLYTIPGSPPNLLHKVTGDAFAPRNKYALNIDSRLEPPMFKISETHSAATWLLHPKAPKVDMPPELRDRIERMKKEGGIA